MDQFAYHINCPSCGQLVEVVNPVIGKQARSVWAELRNQSVFSYAEFSIRETHLACPSCQAKLTVCWET